MHVPTRDQLLRSTLTNATYFAYHLRLLVDDLRFAAYENNRLYYAVDFTELYAFAFPSFAVTSLRVFPDDTLDESLIHQGVALSRVFEFRPALLPPYRIELQRFAQNLPQLDFMRTTETARRAQLELRQARSTTPPPAIQSVLSRDDDDILANGLSLPEVDAIMGFLRGSLPSLLELVAGPAQRGSRRMAELQLGDRLRDWPIKLPAVAPDHAVYSRWVTFLRQQRHRGDNDVVDALAAAMVSEANVHSLDHVRFRLITRSMYMHERMALDIATRPGPQAEDHFLRDPSVFAWISGLEERPDGRVVPDDKSILQLESQVTSLEAFVAAAQQLQHVEAGSDALVGTLWNQWSAVRGDFRRLHTDNNIARFFMQTPDVTDKHLVVHEAVPLLRRKLSSATSSVMFRALKDMDQRLADHVTLFSVATYGLRRSYERAIEARVGPDRYAGGAIMASSADVPCRPAFVERDVSTTAERIWTGDGNWSEILELLIAGERHGLHMSHDRLLLIGWLLACYGDWKWAGDFAHQASIAPQVLPSSMFEARFLQISVMVGRARAARDSGEMGEAKRLVATIGQGVDARKYADTVICAELWEEYIDLLSAVLADDGGGPQRLSVLAITGSDRRRSLVAGVAALRLWLLLRQEQLPAMATCAALHGTMLDAHRSTGPAAQLPSDIQLGDLGFQARYPTVRREPSVMLLLDEARALGRSQRTPPDVAERAIVVQGWLASLPSGKREARPN